MTPIPTASLRPARLLGLMTPLAVMVGPGRAAPAAEPRHAHGPSQPCEPVTLLGNGAASQSAAAAVESPPVMR